MLKFLKNWTLPIAMLLGGIGYPLFIRLSFLTPALIFTMLLLTFCKVSPRDLRPKPLHLWLLLIQIFGAIAVCSFFVLIKLWLKERWFVLSVLRLLLLRLLLPNWAEVRQV